MSSSWLLSVSNTSHIEPPYFLPTVLYVILVLQSYFVVVVCVFHKNPPVLHACTPTELHSCVNFPTGCCDRVSRLQSTSAPWCTRRRPPKPHSAVSTTSWRWPRCPPLARREPAPPAVPPTPPAATEAAVWGDKDPT